MAGHYFIPSDPTLTEGWGIIARDLAPGPRRRAHYYRGGQPVCGIGYRLHSAPYTGPLRARRDLDSNCERCEQVLNPGERRNRRTVSLYFDSRQCRRCGHDYLYPGYGSKRGVCNNCLDTYGRRTRWDHDTARRR